MFFLDLDAGTKVIRRFGAIICDVIYTLISKVYELFITVARLNILSSPQIQPIYQRVTMILTIVMVFYITFEFVKYTISPDTITDKEKGAGNILKRVIIVISLIALVPEIFTTAYKLQNRIIETQLISKVILGTGSTDYTTYGNEFSANTLNLFYYYDEDACSSSSAGLINECSEAQKTVTENLNKIRTTGDSDIVTGINLASGKATFKEVNPAIKFNGILAIIVGGFILYILVMYSIDVGTRYAQLIFLQVISPIAIMGYILPKKDGIFQKWGKQCITTYIDLFLRIAIINFVLLIVKVLGDGFESGNIFSGIGNVSGSLKTFAYIVLVMGLLVFAQRAPKLLGELFPSSGSAGIGFGLGSKNRFEPTTKAVKGTLGTAGKVVGGVAGGVAGAYLGARQNGWARGTGKGRVWSAVKGAARGTAGGLGKNGGLTKGLKAARESANKDRDVIEAGGSPVGASFLGGHYANVAKDQDIEIARYEAMKTKKKAVSTAVENMKFRQQIETMGQAIGAKDATAGKEWVITTKKAEKLARQYADGKIDAIDLQLGVNQLIDKFNNDMSRRNIDVTASHITTGSINHQMDINGRKIEKIKDETARNIARTAWQAVQKNYATLTTEHNNGTINDIEYEDKVNELLAAFNSSMATNNIDVDAYTVRNGSDDFEIDSAKWGTVHAAIEDARTVAKELGEITYTTVDSNGNSVKQTVKYDENTFAANVGDFSDASEAKISETKTGSKYKASHANAEASGKK